MFYQVYPNTFLAVCWVEKCYVFTQTIENHFAFASYCHAHAHVHLHFAAVLLPLSCLHRFRVVSHHSHLIVIRCSFNFHFVSIFKLIASVC